MADLNRTVFVATKTYEGDCVLRSLSILSGGFDISHTIPFRTGATYEDFKGESIFWYDDIVPCPWQQ